MTKVLVIPSWYPTPDNHAPGSFFEEQMKFLHQSGLDVRVLYVEQSLYPKRNFFSNPTFPWITSFEKISSEPLTFYRKQTCVRILFDGARINLLFRSYVKGWKLVTKDGWFPDQILALSAVDAALVAKKLSYKYKVPYSVIEHSILYLERFRSGKRKALLSALNAAKALGAVSHHLVRHLLMHGVDASPKIVWNLVDDEKFPLRKPERHQEFLVLTMAYPQREKDMDTFFRAINVVRKSTNESFRALVVGNDVGGSSRHSSTRKIESLAKKYGVHDLCDFIPYVVRRDLPAYFAKADVFISSSISETFGVAIREAMMSGVPVVSTRNGGVEDTIDGRNGFLVNVQDYAGIANYVLALMNGAASIDQMQARSLVVAQSGRAAFLKAIKAFLSPPTDLLTPKSGYPSEKRLTEHD